MKRILCSLALLLLVCGIVTAEYDPGRPDTADPDDVRISTDTLIAQDQLIGRTTGQLRDDVDTKANADDVRISTDTLVAQDQLIGRTTGQLRIDVDGKLDGDSVRVSTDTLIAQDQLIGQATGQTEVRFDDIEASTGVLTAIYYDSVNNLLVFIPEGGNNVYVMSLTSNTIQKNTFNVKGSSSVWYNSAGTAFTTINHNGTHFEINVIGPASRWERKTTSGFFDYSAPSGVNITVRGKRGGVFSDRYEVIKGDGFFKIINYDGYSCYISSEVMQFTSNSNSCTEWDFEITHDSITSRSNLHHGTTFYGVVGNFEQLVSHSPLEIDSPVNFNRQVIFNGNSDFVGDSCCYGEIYDSSGTTVITLTSQNIWYQVNVMTSTGVLRDVTAPGNELKISTSGVYDTYFGSEFTCSAKEKTIEIGIFRNDQAGEFEALRRIIYTNGVDTENLVEMKRKVNLTANDTIEVWVRCTCSAGNTITFINPVLGVEKK